MKIRTIQIAIIIITLISFGCQKSDLKKDGYFVFNANDKNSSFNSCVWVIESYLEDTIPVHMNSIFANQRKDQDDGVINFNADHVYIVFDGTTTGSYSTPVWVTLPNAFYIEIGYEDVLYSMFQIDQDGNPFSNVRMDIDTYDVNGGIVAGSISGTFFNSNSNNTLEISHCDFSARINQ